MDLLFVHGADVSDRVTAIFISPANSVNVPGRVTGWIQSGIAPLVGKPCAWAAVAKRSSTSTVLGAPASWWTEASVTS